LSREDEFEEHRDHLMGVAYRVLGTHTEAEDAVQEAYLRYATADRDGIRDLRGWLTTTTARICLDALRSARVRRETYVGPWLPEPLVERLPSDAESPDAVAVRGEAVSVAMLVVLETLTPEQRLAFVLHDVFAVPFQEIAAVLGSTPAAARQHASRARRAVAGGKPRHTASVAEQRDVVAAFLAAVRGGDITRLMHLLAPDVVAIGDGGGIVPANRRPVVGADKVARFMAGLFRQAAKLAGDHGAVAAELVLVNGGPGFLIEIDDPPVRLVMGFAVDDGLITGIFDQVNPDKLGAIPHVDPARNLLAAG
jgi:RNA polymerase sigma-70 factor, ECF subfamily